MQNKVEMSRTPTPPVQPNPIDTAIKASFILGVILGSIVVGLIFILTGYPGGPD